MQATLSAFLLLAGASSPAAAPPCRNPPPIFHCWEWRRNAAGRLVAQRDVTAGIAEIPAGTYLGEGTVIDGIDYTAALEQQCGR